MNKKILPLILIFSLVPLGPLAIDIFLPSIPQMVEAFQATDNDIKLTISIYVFALGICQLIAGPISDRFGRKTSAMLGLGFYAIGSLSVTVAPTLTLLYAARILQGIGASFTMVTAFSWVRDHYDGEAAGKWLSYMMGMSSVVPTIAPLIGGALAMTWGWRSGFFVMGTTGIILLLLASITLKREKPISTNSEVTGSQHLKVNLKNILSSNQFRTYNFASTICFGGLITYIGTAPIVAMKEGGLNEIQFATYIGIIGLLQLVFSFLAPQIVALIGQSQIVFLGLAISTLSGVGLLIVPDDATYAYFFMAALGCSGFSLIVGTATSMTLQPFKHCAGLVSSIDGFLRMVGGSAIAGGLFFLGLSNVNTLGVAMMLTLIPLFLVSFDIRLRDNSSLKKVEII